MCSTTWPAKIACRAYAPADGTVSPAPSHAGKIDQVGLAAARGRAGRIVAKMNALTDGALVRALVLAGQRGARIDLIVRGACILPPQLAGVTTTSCAIHHPGGFWSINGFYFRCGKEERAVLLQCRLDEPPA